MKKIFAGMILMVSLAISTLLYAAPERIMIKDAGKKAKEKSALTRLKSIELDNIEDPAARSAIADILNYLDLPSGKKS